MCIRDSSAVVIAHCNGPNGFFPLVRAFYDTQPDWEGNLQKVPQSQTEQLENLPENQIALQAAKIAGFLDWAAARGVPQAKSNQCLSDQKMIDKEAEVTSNVNEEFPDFTGTPSFVINGTMAKDTAEWKKLQPQLDAALK